MRLVRPGYLSLSALLVLWLDATVSRALADVADISLLGDQANTMAGAVTASTQGGPSIWYNPSRLSFAEDQRFVFSVSGAGAAMRLYNIPYLVSSEEQVSAGRTSELLTLPRATTLVVQGRRALRWGIGLFVPTLQDVTFQASQSSSLDDERTFTGFASHVRRESFHGVGAVGFRLGSRLQLGASLGLMAYSFFRSTQLSSATYTDASGASSAQFSTSLQRDNLGYGFRVAVGASLRITEQLLLGVSVTAPSMVVYAFVEELGSESSASAPVETDFFEPRRKDKHGGTWQTVEPGLVRIGLAWETANSLWEIDGEVTSGASGKDFEVDSHVSGNLRVGAIVGLLQNVRAGFGFFTDLDPPDERLKQIGDARMRGLGGTLGANVVSRIPGQRKPGEHEAKGTFSLTVSTRYVHYQGDVLALHIESPGQPQTLTTVISEGTVHELAVQLGVNGAW